jgi:GT2 family glycosyltransferase
MTELLSVIIVSYNTRALLRECLLSLRRHLGALRHEVLVVDNASHDGSAAEVERDFAEVQLLRSPENLGFGRANNLAMQAAHGDVFLLINSDARLLDDSVVALVAALRARPDVGVMGPRLQQPPDGRLQPSAYRFGWLRLIALEELGVYKLVSRRKRADLLLGGYWDHASERDADWLVGACMLVRREAFERAGGFDPAIFLYGEEEEWCERIRATGLRIVFWPNARVEHVGHASALSLLGDEGRLRRCLQAADRHVKRREGFMAALLLWPVRVIGALQRLVYFSVRRLWQAPDSDSRRALWTAQVVLRHCLRRPALRV